VTHFRAPLQSVLLKRSCHAHFLRHLWSIGREQQSIRLASQGREEGSIQLHVPQGQNQRELYQKQRLDGGEECANQISTLGLLSSMLKITASTGRARRRQQSKVNTRSISTVPTEQVVLLQSNTFAALVEILRCAQSGTLVIDNSCTAFHSSGYQVACAM
jgi:hypothetical protein